MFQGEKFVKADWPSFCTIGAPCMFRSNHKKTSLKLNLGTRYPQIAIYVTFLSPNHSFGITKNRRKCTAGKLL